MFFRRFTLLAASALAFMTSVHTPEVIQAPSLSVTAPPLALRLPTCMMGSYHRPRLGFTPINNTNTTFFSDNTHTFLAPLAVPRSIIPLYPPIPLAHSPPRLGVIDHLADLDFDKLDLVFAGTLTFARFIRAKTGIVWWRACLWVIVFGELVIWEGLGLGEDGATWQQLVLIGRAGVDALLSLLAVISAVKWRRALAFGFGVVRQVSAIPGVVLIPFDVPLAHLVASFASDGTLVSVLAERFSFVHRLLRILRPSPKPLVCPKKRYKHQRRRAKGQPSVVSAKSRIRRGCYLGVDVLLHVLKISGVVTLFIDVPISHLAYALCLHGTLVATLADRFPLIRKLLCMIYPPPTYSIRRAKKRYKRGAKTKP
ncbi:hypothetical protein B0H11DRAFT_248745 [Mycena galericulata]|nr:hypothetical protein B0H11DRAFT_248745 [Mycena galericulata]